MEYETKIKILQYEQIVEMKMVEQKAETEHNKKQYLQYGELMQKVGDRGKYQWIVYGLVLYYWMYNGFMISCLSFFFLNPGFDCSSLSIPTFQCEKYICDNFSPSQYPEHEKTKQIQSLVTEFGPYYCEKNYSISIFRSFLFFAASISFILLIGPANNFSRRGIILLSLACCTFGSGALVMAPDMVIALVGFVLIGVGLFGPVRYGLVVVSEVTERERGEVMIATLLGGAKIGGLLSAVAFGLIGHWRYVALYCSLLPSLIALTVTYFMMQDTPKMLLRGKKARQACQALNRIGELNKNQSQIITLQQIENYLIQQQRYDQVKQFLNPLDLLRFASLRIPAIVFCMIGLGIDLIFYADSAMIDKIGFNPTLNQTLINVAGLVGLLLIIAVVGYTPRRLSGMVNFGLAALFNFINCLVIVPTNCEDCSQVFWQMGFVMLARVLISFQFSMFYVNQAEFYPVSIRTMGLGISGLFGTLALGISQIIIVGSGETGFNPFLFISMVALVTAILYCFAPETHKVASREQILQVEEQANNGKQD